MIEQDTIKLLRECDAGVKMGVSSIEDVLGSVTSDRLEKILTDCKEEHEKLDRELQEILDKFNDDGKEPAAIAKGMSWMKTNMKLAMNETDATIADLMTDGCNMGVKSLNKYLNKYEAADEVSKDITKRLINLEEKLAVDQREYEENLRTILELMKDKKVIFITSTPVERERYPEGFPFVRYEDDVVEYNRIANNVMHSYNVEVIDMYSFTKSLGLCGDALYRDHAHFHKQIIQLQAAYLAGALSALVKRESV